MIESILLATCVVTIIYTLNRIDIYPGFYQDSAIIIATTLAILVLTMKIAEIVVTNPQ